MIGGGDVRTKKRKKPTKERKKGKQIHRGYCFDRCGYVVAVVRRKRERKRTRENEGCVTWLLVWFIIR